MPFWVGGSGNWSDAANHWAATSGGAPGVGNLPDLTKDAIFNANSNTTAYTVTIDTAGVDCKDLNFSAAPSVSGTITFSGTIVRPYGNLVLLSGMTINPIQIQMNGVSGTSTITSNGVSIAAGFSLVGAGTFQLVDSFAMTMNATTFRQLAGTFNQNGQSITLTNTGSPATIIGAWSLSSLTLVGGAFATSGWTISANLTISGLLTITGNSAINRCLISSDILGTSRTITAGSVSLTNVDFQDTVGAGVASPFTGTSLGNALGNSGITFTTSVTQYWYTPTTGVKTWSTVGNWFLATGGTGGAGRIPLPQDDVIFDASSIGAASTSIQADMPRLGRNITWTGVTNAPSFTPINNSTASIFGNWLGASGMTVPGGSNNVFRFFGRSSHTITCAGVTFTPTINISLFGGSLQLLDALATGRVIRIAGTLDTNGFAMSCIYMDAAGGAYTKALTLGASTLTITSSDLAGTGSVFSTISSDTITASTGTIKIVDSTAASKTFAGGGKTYNNVWFAPGIGIGNLLVTGANIFNDFKDDGTQGHSVIWANNLVNAAATWTLSGRVPSGDMFYAQCLAIAGNKFTTPATATLNNTGDKDICICLKLTATIGAGGVYGSFVDAATGFLIRINPAASMSLHDGLSNISSNAVLSAAGTYNWVRVRHQVNNGASGRTTKFYTSTDPVTTAPTLITWVQLGTDVITATASNLSVGNGRRVGGVNSTDLETPDCQVHRVIEYNGFLDAAGTKTLDFYPANFVAGLSWTSGTTSEVWTIGGSALVSKTNLISFVSNSTTLNASISSTTSPGSIQFDYMSIKNVTALNNKQFYAGLNSLNNNATNQGWAYGVPATRAGSTSFSLPF